jgi:aryl-alcohol dehydrogenase-like predicted oxidoreductase
MKMTRRDLLAATAGVSLGALAPAKLFGQTPTLMRKPIPSSGELIPVIGLGTARRYQDPKSEAEWQQLRDTLQKFKEVGATVIDTAPTYGAAEEVVGRILDDQKSRPGLFLATKVSVTGREAGVAQIEQSFERLRTDTIDLIAVHNLRDTDVHLATLRALKEAGRIRYVGCTTSFKNQYAAFEETMKREALDFIQIDYALDNRSAADRILPLAQERGMAVMVNLPLGRARLFALVRGKPLPEWAADFDCRSWAQFFLKYAVSHDAVTCAIPGMARPAYVVDNIGAAHGRLPDAAMRKRMERLIDGG